jgi:hypothetical protein
MMLAENFDEGSDPDKEPIQDKVGGAIRDAELAQIAAFKLRECATRLETLADAGQGSALCEELRTVGRELRRVEIELLRNARRDE